MRVSNWNPQKFDTEFIEAAMDRLVKAAMVVKAKAEVNCPFGSISRPMYKKGPYANRPWTARDAGQLKKSIRIVTKAGSGRNVRIYAGNYYAYYAAIVEYSTPFLRTALNSSKEEIRNILENG
jgi:hypothetical protein